MLRVFLGWDNKEKVGYHVCDHSINVRSSIPVLVSCLNRDHYRGFFSRERGAFDSTDFAISRFLVPFLCDYEGFAVFMDGSDMICLSDIAELSAYMTLMDKYNYAVRVVKHDYQPKEDKKFLGALQTKYEKKNWSSVMIFNNSLCRTLTPEYVNNAHGLDLHQFKWCQPYQVADMPKKWNWLVGEPGYERLPPDVGVLHYTKGSPFLDEYRDCDYAELWRAEYEDMVSHG